MPSGRGFPSTLMPAKIWSWRQPPGGSESLIASAETGFELEKEGHLLLWLGITLPTQVDGRGNETVGVHAERLVLQIPQAAQEQAGSGE